MRMLKSGLKLVLDTDWIMNMDDGIIEDIIAKCNIYNGVKYYYYDPYNDEHVLQNFEVKLPANHRYILTYYNPDDDIASTVAIDTLGIEEMYKADADEQPDQTGYQVVFLYFYDIDGEVVSGSDYAFTIANYGIRLNPMWVGNYSLKIYQLD